MDGTCLWKVFLIEIRLKAVGCINDLNELMPDQPESLYLYNEKNKKVQRVRHKKQ